MPQVKTSIVIDAPVEKVYDYLLHVAENGPVWIPSVMEHRNVSPGGPKVGQSWEWTFNMAGVPLHGRSELSVLEHLKRGEMKASGDTTSTWLFTYTAQGQSSRIDAQIDYEIPGKVLGKLANRVLIERMNQKLADEGLANLKIILES